MDYATPTRSDHVCRATEAAAYPANSSTLKKKSRMMKTTFVCWPIKPDISTVSSIKANIPDATLPPLAIFCSVHWIPFKLIDPSHRGLGRNIYGFSMAVERKSFCFALATEWVICVLANCWLYQNNIYGFIAFLQVDGGAEKEIVPRNNLTFIFARGKTFLPTCTFACGRFVQKLSPPFLKIPNFIYKT